MGGIGQSAHLNVLLESGAVEARQFVSLTGRPPRSGLIAGLVIDDFILLEVVPSNPGNSDRKGPETMRLVREAYLSAGLPRHPDKSVHGALELDFWGCTLEGRSARLRPNHRRAIPLAHLLLSAVELGSFTGELLQTLAGGLCSCFQLRRRRRLQA